MIYLHLLKATTNKAGNIMQINDSFKSITSKVPKALWMYLRISAIENNMSVNELVVSLLEKSRKKLEAKDKEK